MKKVSGEDLSNLIDLARDNNILARHRGFIGIRMVLAKKPRIKWIDNLVDDGLIDGCLACLRQSKYPQLKLEGAWIINLIISNAPDYVDAIIDEEGIRLIL